jgi:hypothetical protein
VSWSERTTNWGMVEGGCRVFGVVCQDSKRCHMLVDGRNLRNFGFKKLSDDRSPCASSDARGCRYPSL